MDRLTRDVDLFTNELSPAAFDAAVNHLLAEFRRAGYDVEEVRRSEQFVQLRIETIDGRSVDMDLAVDWREHEPVIFPLGAVLSAEDAVGSKVSALYTRGEARDYIDVDAIRASGRFSDAELMSAAQERDAGFEVAMFALQLDRIETIAPRRFEEYDVDAAQLVAMRERFGLWGVGLRENVAPLGDEQEIELNNGLTARDAGLGVDTREAKSRSRQRRKSGTTGPHETSSAAQSRNDDVYGKGRHLR